MTRLRSFSRGGVRLPPRKERTRAEPISNAALPSLAIIPMRQHAGEPAECLVRPGDVVKEGMLIGRARGETSANVHASIPGRVSAVGDVFVASGETSVAAFIELEGEFHTSGGGRRPAAWEGISPGDLIQRVRAAGVVGLGGDFSPTHVKLSAARRKGVEILVADGVECEPFLGSDQRLMAEKPSEIVEGMRIVQRIVSAKRIVLALSASARKVSEQFQRIFIYLGPHFSVEFLSNKFPQGEESLIARALNLEAGDPAAGDRGARAREERPRQPAGATPAQAARSKPGTLVMNVATLHAIWEAVALEKPVIDRIVTVAGPLVRHPRNLKVRLGTPVGDLFDECGGPPFTGSTIVLGGPMTGRIQVSLDVPVTKTVGAVLAFPRRKTRELPCIRCGRCIDVCPWGLDPLRQYSLIMRGDVGAAAREGLSRCRECGCCAYVCPSRMPLTATFARGKILALAAHA